MPVTLAGAASGERLSLEIPPDSAHILTVRLFAGGVARSLSLDDETADLLRLALTEVCSESIEQGREGRIVIDVSADADPIRVTVVAAGDLDDGTHSSPAEATYRRTLIEALVPDVTFVEERDRLTIGFTLEPN
jgi:anti-sigma regulatory factor (Ser/Thr protein kinase)